MLVRQCDWVAKQCEVVVKHWDGVARHWDGVGRHWDRMGWGSKALGWGEKEWEGIGTGWGYWVGVESLKGIEIGWDGGGKASGQVAMGW